MKLKTLMDLCVCLIGISHLSLTSLSASIVYSYDNLGRIVNTSYPSGHRIEYTYDAAGNRTSYVATAPGSIKSESLAVAAGGSSEIAITNAGEPGASYDWYRNGVKLGTTSAPSLALSGFTPQDAGGYRVVVREADGSVSIVDLMVKLTGLTYDSWLEFMEGAGASANDPGLGRTEQAQLDGVENILKYAMGKGPHESVAGSLPRIVSLGEGPQRRLGLTLSRIFDPGDIAIRIEASEDLNEWFDVTELLALAGEPVVASNGLSEEVSFEVQNLMSPESGGAFQFFRLRVDPTPN